MLLNQIRSGDSLGAALFSPPKLQCSLICCPIFGILCTAIKLKELNKITIRILILLVNLLPYSLNMNWFEPYEITYFFLFYFTFLDKFFWSFLCEHLQTKILIIYNLLLLPFFPFNFFLNLKFVFLLTFLRAWKYANIILILVWVDVVWVYRLRIN